MVVTDNKKYFKFYNKLHDNDWELNKEYMMSNTMNKVIIRYHPAVKKIEFPDHIDNDDKLYGYLREEFVLQQADGEQLCEAIVSLVSNREVQVDVTTTKEDFKDFEGMVEKYNNSQEERQICATLVAELPDMHSLYKNVVEYGKQIVNYIENNKIKLSAKTNFVKTIEEEFSKEIDYNIKKINKDIESMEDNNVNLCVTGAYSAGKSVLINAILGHEILPHAIESKTANIFKIKSPDDGTEALHFDVDKIPQILSWKDDKFRFVTKKPTHEKARDIYDEITNSLEKNTCESYQQLFSIIDILNNNSEHTSNILIEFPIPLDTDAFKFTIFDTPGTDSDYSEHQDTLNKALEEQTHSIMIFVVMPKKIEGSGNRILLQCLKDKGKNKTNIDIDRSIFVMNQADTVNTFSELEELREKKLSIDGYSIELKNQKLFFLSALQGYIAKAKKNKSKIREDAYDIGIRYNPYEPNEEKRQYFRCNRYGASKIRTQEVIQKSETELSHHTEKEDKMIVSSGLYALESEIQNYGEKYAIAVRAYSIITSVESFLKTLDTILNTLENKSEEELKKITKDIESKSDDILS